MRYAVSLMARQSVIWMGIFKEGENEE
jgi:hypothetical protein